jgi:hypothetical protein
VKPEKSSGFSERDIVSAREVAQLVVLGFGDRTSVGRANVLLVVRHILSSKKHGIERNAQKRLWFQKRTCRFIRAARVAWKLAGGGSVPILDLRARIVLARPAARWRQTVVNQIIEDMFGYPVGVILTGLRQVDDLVDDDFDHRSINITIEQEGVAESA